VNDVLWSGQGSGALLGEAALRLPFWRVYIISVGSSNWYQF